MKLGKTSERIRSIGDEAIDHVQVVVHFAVDTPLARRVAESFECRGQPETGRKERAIRFCFFVFFVFFFSSRFSLAGHFTWPANGGQWRWAPLICGRRLPLSRSLKKTQKEMAEANEIRCLFVCFFLIKMEGRGTAIKKKMTEFIRLVKSALIGLNRVFFDMLPSFLLVSLVSQRGVPSFTRFYWVLLGFAGFSPSLT